MARRNLRKEALFAIFLFTVSIAELAACGSGTVTGTPTTIGRRAAITPGAPTVTPGLTPQPTATPTTPGQVCVSCGTPPTLTPTWTATPTPTSTPTSTPVPLDLSDHSPSGNSLTNHGGTPVYTNLPFAGDAKAIHFTRSSQQYASAPNSPSLSITGDMTLEALIKLDSLPPGGEFDIAGKWSQSTPRSYLLDLVNPSPGIYAVGFFCTSDGIVEKDYYSNNLSFAKNTWYQVAAVYTASLGQVHFYYTAQNGGSWQTQDAGTVTGLPTSLYSVTTGLTLGANATAYASDYYDGQLDEVRIWNVARSMSDIAANAVNQLTGSEPGLVAYYSF